MEITTLCAVVASLTVFPDRSQIFQYEPITLSCEHQEDSTEWIVKRNTSENVNEECSHFWNPRNSSDCFCSESYYSDTGVYWCESGAGGCSNTVSITVTAGSVILESPVLPVTEGEAVTLRCRTGTTSNLTADFYKDQVLIGSSSTGNFTIGSVSKSDEGLYKCNVSGDGGSALSRLTVRGRPERCDQPFAHILLPVVGVCVCILLMLLMLLCLRRGIKGKMNSAVSYTDVTFTQEVKPRRVRDLDATPTFYSTLSLDAI
ncbi:low affinity immunoglobulin gamma Fc region receptor II-b-like [Embiotoca jacksoni]|uniref:low affinity immunoglobulin gamma Fc region receptor II-b-like n=1 Tax=Embiotoca jacksoni TaxID=100190 RepID=UPI0037044EA1